MPKMGKLYRENYGNVRITNDGCDSRITRSKIFLYYENIKKIEDDTTISQEEKIRRIKALRPKDNCFHRIVDRRYNRSEDNA